MILLSLHRSLGYRVRSLAVAAILPIAVCSGAFAALLIPNGNPTGVTPAVAANGSSALDLNATYEVAGSCPWLLPALAAQGFSPANNWTINLIALNGNLSLGTYAPWVNTDPAITQGNLVYPAEAANGLGGANFGLSYVPAATTSTVLGANNPATSVTHWIQVVHTTAPLGFGVVNGVNGGGGYTNYIDDGYNANGAVPSNPFYDSGYAANSVNFVDSPSRQLAGYADWQAQVFLAEWLPNNANNSAMGGTLDIYDGVWWGFNVPEPGCASLLGGSMIMLLRRRGRRADAPQR